MKWGTLCLLHNPMTPSQDRSLSLTRPLVFSGRVNRVFGKYAEMDTCQPSKFIVYILHIYIHIYIYVYTHTCRQTIHFYCLFTHLLLLLCLPKRCSQRPTSAKSAASHPCSWMSPTFRFFTSSSVRVP